MLALMPSLSATVWAVWRDAPSWWFTGSSIVCPPSPSHPPRTSIYVFIHDAVLESLTCGDSQIPDSGLSGAQ